MLAAGYAAQARTASACETPECGGDGSVAEQAADDTASVDASTPVAIPARRARRPRRRVVALGIVAALLLVAAAGAFALLNAGSGPSPIEAYAPRDAAVFAEVRFDAPGDQKVALAQLLVRLPHLSEPPNVSGEMTRGVASLVGAATGLHVEGDAADVRPWVGGAIGVATFLPPDGGTPRLLAVIGVRDIGAAGAWADAYLAAAGGMASVDAVPGGTLRHGPGGSATAVVDGAAFGGGTGSVLLAGAEGDVRAALDAASTGRGLASTDAFRLARSALPGDELARGFVDTSVARSWLAAGGWSQLGWPAGQGAVADALLARLPAWVAIRLRAEGDALLLGEANAGGSSSGVASGDPIAGTLPADTIAVLDLRDAGAFLTGWLDALRTTDASAEIERLDGAIAGVGGFRGLLRQVGAADVLATWDGSVLRAGLVLRSTDAAATRRLLDSVLALAAFAKAPLADQPYGGATITTVRPPDTVELPLIGRPTVEVAMRGDLLMVGMGSGFAAAVLDAGPGHSLADQPAYQRALARAGTSGSATCFVDAQAARTVGDRMGIGASASPGAQPPATSAGTTALLDALEALGCDARTGNSVSTITVAVTVR